MVRVIIHNPVRVSSVRLRYTGSRASTSVARVDNECNESVHRIAFPQKTHRSTPRRIASLRVPEPNPNPNPNRKEKPQILNFLVRRIHAYTTYEKPIDYFFFKQT